MTLVQVAIVYPTADQAAAAIKTISASTASCQKNTVKRDQAPAPGSTTNYIPAGQDSWRMATDDEAGWSGWRNTQLQTFDNREDEINDDDLLLRRDNVVLELRVNSTTPGPFPGFGKEEQDLASRVLAALNAVAPAGLPAPNPPSPTPHGLPRISADQLCAALNVQKLNSITGLSIKKVYAHTYNGGDMIECIYDVYTFDIQIGYGKSPQEIQDLNSRVAAHPIPGLGDAAGYDQDGAGVEVRVGTDSMNVWLPAMGPSNPFAPKDMTPPPLTMAAAKQDALTIAKIVLATQF